MKKVIALVLAIALSLSMASMVFADSDQSAKDLSNATNTNSSIAPGTKIKFQLSEDFTAADSSVTNISAFKDYFTDEYFTFTIRYDKGSALVESVKFDGDGYLVVKLKENTDLSAPKISNFDIKELIVKAKKKVVANGETLERGDEFKLKDQYTDGKFVGYIKNNTADFTNLSASLSGTTLPVGKDLKIEDGEKGLLEFSEDGNKKYDESEFKFGNDAAGYVRVYDGDVVFVKYNTEVDLDVVKANPDADMRFVNLAGTFNSNMTFELYAEEDEFVYELKNGKLVETSLKWDDDISAYTGKVRTLTSYVISDIKLVNAATTEETKNPDTGANDVVGVAVALAVVSLVAAGAVSLKK